MKIHTSRGLLTSLLLLASVAQLPAQTLRLRERGTNANDISVQVGQIVTIEVFAELSGIEAAGVSLFITVPEGAFQVVDQRPPEAAGAQPGVQPFVAGPLFEGAGEQANALIPESESIASTFAGQQLEYAVVVGGVGDRVRTGSGVVATFQLVCLQPIDFGQIRIEDNAVLETRLVLSDGVSERRFITTQGMQISITGLELLDIPDVILLPGQADSTQIGRLTRYVQSARPTVNIDSIRWSVEPAELDSIDIEIDPVTKRVKIAPHPEWSGRRRVVWVATEPESAVRPGEPVLSVRDISDIIVNNPPRFLVPRGADGVRRDTVRFEEDQFAYVPGTTPSASRAFSAFDLNEMVEDEDGDLLRFLALGFGAAADPNVRAQVVQETGTLLIWSRQDFTGVDSLRILVTDNLRGGNDTLRVIVEVLPIPDPPRFTLDIEERQPKITRGGTQIYLFAEIVEDVDTPIDSLKLSWNGDPSGNFTVDTTRVAAGLEIAIKGKSDFSGDGRISFTATDPDGLEDTMVIFITASEALPPAVLQDDIKITILPGGPPHLEDLDGFVTDPDDDPEDLSWIVPPVHRSDIDIDEERQLSVAAPVDFIGYEEVVLGVADPSGQGDELKLRIYSSDGAPVAGGLPDLVLDRGDVHREIDLDNYYFDSDDDDAEIFWELPRSNTFDRDNLVVSIDPITHIVTFEVPETAAFATEPVIFRVIDPAGQSATDTMNVTIRSGGGNIADQFSLRPLPADLQIPVGRFTDVFDLDDFVVATPDFDLQSLSWSVSAAAGDISGPSIRDDHTVSIFGFQSGLDTLFFTARDTLGRVQTASAVVRVFGESEVLRLLSIPDIQFIARQTFTDLDLGDFVEDKEAHPDSLVRWSWEQLGGQGRLVISVTDDNTVFATSNDTVEAEVVFIARNVETGISGRDTVRVIALDPSLADRALREFPPVLFAAGKKDSSIVLDEFLPEEFVAGAMPLVRWSVSGQRITQPLIEPQPPHRLVLSGVGERVGIDTLTFTADIGGGFRATGQMEVTVVEPVDDSTLDLQIVPNPIEPSFIDVFVIARRPLAGTPNVIRSFETIDSTVAVRQIEGDLERRGVLIWAGTVQLRGGASGLVSFEAQAFTELGTNVGDTASVDLASVRLGKAVVLAHGGARLELAADAVAAGEVVLLQTQAARRPRPGRGKGAPGGELELLYTIDAYPLGLALEGAGSLRWRGAAAAGDGLYRRQGERWLYLGRAADEVAIEALGRYGVLRDRRPPRLHVDGLPAAGAEWVVDIAEAGSGLAAVELLVDGRPQEIAVEEGRLRWQVPPWQSGAVALEVRARDRAGNLSRWRGAVSLRPQQMHLGANYPNPFNPATTLPFVVPAPAQRVRLSIYNSAGQLVRELLDAHLEPGAHQVRWDGRDQRGAPVGAGVYLYRLQTQSAAQVRRMTLLK